MSSIESNFDRIFLSLVATSNDATEDSLQIHVWPTPVQWDQDLKASAPNF
jgi:hypothetical protein